MVASVPREISTNQSAIHEDLHALLERHNRHASMRPIADHTRLAFETMLQALQDYSGNVIVDACCGVGESTLRLAKNNPNSFVVGIDKSISRLQKHKAYSVADECSNYLLVRADLYDFWRLLAAYVKQNTSSWQITKQCIFYPNPYPKKAQIGKRWYASAVFKDILACSNEIELRSNWRLYLQECLLSAEYYGFSGELQVIDSSAEAISPFERKYLDAGQTCFKLALRSAGIDK